MKQYISELLRQSLTELSPDEAASVLAESSFDISAPKPGFGDYAANAAMVLFKQFQKAPAANPADLAKQLAALVQKYDHKNTFSKIESAGGFINFTLSSEFLRYRLGEVLEQKDDFGRSTVGAGEKVLLEYFQPNMAKPLHLGHLENGIYGDSLFRLLQFTGYNVESDTHLGDWGTQFGLLLYAYKQYGNPATVATNPITELNKLYVKINDEAKANPELWELGKAEFIKLEQADAENTKLWQQFRDWSWQEYEIMYNEVGIRRSDHNWPESFFADKMSAVVDEMKAKGLLVTSQGAQIVDLEAHGLGVAVVIKSDGGTTYLLRDLATYIYRKTQGFNKQLYVVDVRQSHALAQTFKILELLGYIENFQDAVHIAYGFLTLPEGAMSTRTGTIVGVKDFLDDAGSRALEIIEQKNPDLADKQGVSQMIAKAAIKYFILSRNLKNDIVFERDNALSFEGNTGPYLQYAHARINGILRKVGGDGDVSVNSESILSKPEELAVIRKIHMFPEIIERATEERMPNYLCQYLFELSQTFNTFYEACPVSQEPDETIRRTRIALVTATAQVIKNGLALLGIEAPPEM